jgi:hypothetical protein
VRRVESFPTGRADGAGDRVVARDLPDLFSYFDTVFAGMLDIKVLIDRRLAPPEGVIDPERRERGDIYDELQRRGFIMIRMG